MLSRLIGLILVAVGIIAILVKIGILAGSIWSYTWPMILIILGLAILLRRAFWRWGFDRHSWRRHGGCSTREEDEEKK